MAVQTIVLYGPSRLYDPPTYSTNQDPQALVLNLSDSSTLVDTGFQFLADALSLIETTIQNDTIKALADSLSLTEAQLFASIKVLVDSISVADATVAIAQIKGLSDFILVKDWVEMKLQKADGWTPTTTFNFRPSKIHNYGPGVYYGIDFYSSNPTVYWLLTTPARATWAANSVVKAALPLYGTLNYGSKPYTSTPSTGWTKPGTQIQNWQNANGESH